MLMIKIFFKLLKAKASLIVTSLAGGVLVYVLFDSALFAILFTVGIFLYRYLTVYGATHYESREKIKILNNKNIIFDTLVNPLSSDMVTLNLNENAWVKGIGSVINCYIDKYYVQHSKSGLYFYNESIPYLNTFILPWENIVGVTKNTQYIERYDILSKEKNAFELSLIGGDKIILPLNELCINKLKDKNNKKGQ